jgi:signal transduction histidine kinase
MAATENSARTRATFALMAGGLLALIVIVAAAIWLAGRTVALNDAAATARLERFHSSNILTALLDAETGQRGYLLTLNDSYLVPFNRAAARWRGELAQLRSAVASDPADRQQAELVAKLAEEKMAELSHTVALAKAGHAREALIIVRSNRGRDFMGMARVLLTRLLTRTDERVRSLSDQVNAAALRLEWLTVVAGGLIVLFATVSAWLTAGSLDQATSARAEVEALNTRLEQRVKERTAALSQANEEIQRFAYIVSHDLRAPLVNILGFTSELELGTASLQKFVDDHANPALAEAARRAAHDDIPEAVRFIRASTTKMDSLINAILKLSREGRRALRPETIDLSQVLTTVTASLRHQATEAGTTIIVPEHAPRIISDRLALEQVFGNLLDNALKYLANDRPGRVEIRVDDLPASVCITVADNGRGIAGQDHERIFELFRRAGPQNRPGEGIGLTHVRALVRRLGGDIILRSQLGEGSEFCVQLPKLLPQQSMDKT